VSRKTHGDVFEIQFILTRMLNQWIENYLRKREGGGCKRIPDTHSFEKFVASIVKYARSGT
jgi:hypothetical protein